jgi:hypothetical protein
MLATLAGPFLAGQIYTSDDLGAFHLPLRAFYADCLARGESFDWSPQLFCGFYLTGEGQIGGYHPLHRILYRFLPLPIAFDLECLLSYPFMLFGMYLLLRRWDVRRDAALFGGLTFAFSGFSLLHFVHVNGIAVVAHIPWLLLAIHSLMVGATRNRKMFGGIGLALLTGSQLLLGYPQYVMLSVIAEAGYTVMLIRGERRTGGSGDLLKRAAPVVAWIALGVMIGGIQLIPTLDALQDSSRQAAEGDFAGWGSLHPLNLVQFVAPYLFQTRVVGQNTHELGLYAGAVTLLLAVWGIANPPGGAHLRRLACGAMILVALGLLLAFGEHTPLHWFVSRLPLLNKFRFPCRAIVLVHLGLAVMAALGLASLSIYRNAGVAIRAARVHSVWAIWIVAALGIIMAIVGPLYWPEHVAEPTLVWIGPVLLTLGALLITLARFRPQPAIMALALLSAIDLGTYGMSYAVYSHTAVLDRYVASIPTPPGAAGGRVALDLAPANRPGLHAGNQLLLAGWMRVDGYAGLEPARQLDYRQTAALRAAGVGWVAEDADLANRASLELAAPRWLRIENPVPRVRLVAEAIVAADPARDISKTQLETTALVERRLPLQPGRPGKVELLADQPGEIRLSVDSPGRQLLVLIESFHSGWEATTGGEPLPIVRVNGDFMGCVVTPGTSEIEFRFRPASLRFGAWISILGVSLIAAATVFCACRTRIHRS